MSGMKFEVIPAERGIALREAFIRRFIDWTGAYYQEHIGFLPLNENSRCYDGYLWDCLRDNEQWKKACGMDAAAKFLRGKGHVFAMWDLFSDERVRNSKRLFAEYPKGTVIRVQGRLLAQTVEAEWEAEQAAWRKDCQCEGLWLPEDLYCFDETLNWYVIFTHEGWDHWTNPELDEDAYIRVCFLSK